MLRKFTLPISILVIVPLLSCAAEVNQKSITTNRDREALISLDIEVAEFYLSSYESLDQKNVTFNEQLWRALRAIRHTNVVHHHDFTYTSNDTKAKSAGARVKQDLCRIQLGELVRIVNASSGQLDASLPLSVIDFLSSSGQVGSGVLNGNFFWPGSYESCIRAHISASTLDLLNLAVAQERFREDIEGRYCVAHLRAKSWPSWDPHFGDRLTLKRALCLPASCHSIVYDADPQIQELTAYLALSLLPHPFTSHSYVLQNLYCLPDEDSEFRQLDFNAELFIGFVSFWLLLTIYVNVKYHRRQNTMHQLRKAVDIRMVINQRRSVEDVDDKKDEPEEVTGLGPLEINLNKLIKLDGTSDASVNELNDGDLSLKLQHSREKSLPSPTMGGYLTCGSGLMAGSSNAATPLTSDIDDEDNDDYGHNIDGEGSMNGAVGGAERRRKTKANVNYDYRTASTCNSLMEALSVERNLKFLFYRPRERKNNDHDNAASNKAEGLNSRSGSRRSSKTSQHDKRGSHSQLAAVARRSSSSNEALIKDLAPEQNANVTIVRKSSDKLNAKGKDGDELADDDGMRGRRVNVEILDGFKVIATSYIVYGHTFMFFFGCLTDIRFGVEHMLDITMLITINGLHVVGLFYIITGCLLTYFSFTKTKKRNLLKPTFWLLVLVGRYLRLIPLYALVFWFARHVAQHTGSGRDWYDYRTDVQHPRGFCDQESWSIMWTMSTADIKIPMDCVPQAWYLSNDFRTLLILPIYVCLLATNLWLGYSAIFATFAYSTLKLVDILRAANIDYKVMLLWHPHVYSLMADRLHGVYTDFSVRMSTYLLGVIVGHLLYLYETRFIIAWPRWLRRYGLKVALALGSQIFFGALLIANPHINQFLPKREEVNSDAVVWLIPLFKSTMEICMCLMVLLVVTGGSYKWLKRAMSSQLMKILSNISYAVYLTHIEIMYKIPASQFESNYWILFIYSSFFIIFAHVVSFFLYLFWEMPINNLTRHFFKRAYRAISE